MNRVLLLSLFVLCAANTVQCKRNNKLNLGYHLKLGYVIPQFIDKTSRFSKVFISFEKKKNVFPGFNLSKKLTAKAPTLKWKAKRDISYTMVMVDPDIDNGHYVNWLVGNIRGNNIKNGDTIFEYHGPIPIDKDLDMNRYVVLVYEQMDDKIDFIALKNR